MKLATRTAIALVMVVAIGALLTAAKVKVRTQHDEAYDFTGKQTYAWHPDGTGEVKLLQNSYEKPDVLKAKFDPIIMQAMDVELGKRGFTKATSGVPDFYLYYYLLIGPNSSSQFQGQFIGAVPSWGLPDFMMSTTALRFFEQGTLVVDVSAAALKATVWRGVAEAEIDRDNRPEERIKRIQGAVAEMVKKFPPPPKKK